jgi:Domain of unknown function (DUF4386)
MIMTGLRNDISQRTAAKVAGLSLLVLIIFGVFNNFFIAPRLIVDGDAVKTTHNIVASETLYRFGIVCSLIMFNCDIIEALALYVLLKPINKSLALLGTFWRLGNAFIGGFAAISSFYILRLASNPDYLTALNPKQSHSLMMLFINTDEDSLIELIFFSFGMVVHGYLLFKSKYIPRILACLYFFSAVLLLISAFTLIVFPKAAAVISPIYVLPDFVAELSFALWLIFKGVNLPLADTNNI